MIGFVAGPFAPPYITGSYESALPANDFIAFTIGSTAALDENPLPIKLVDFDIASSGQESMVIKWKIAEHLAVNVIFVIEESGIDGQFSEIGRVVGKPMTETYSFVDLHMKTGATYYRLKIIERDNRISYSRIRRYVASQKQPVEIRIVAINQSLVRLRIYTPHSLQFKLSMIDCWGRMVRSILCKLENGFTTYDFSMNGLAHGSYFLLAQGSGFALPALRMTW